MWRVFISLTYWGIESLINVEKLLNHQYNLTPMVSNSTFIPAHVSADSYTKNDMKRLTHTQHVQYTNKLSWLLYPTNAMCSTWPSSISFKKQTRRKLKQDLTHYKQTLLNEIKKLEITNIVYTANAWIKARGNNVSRYSLKHCIPFQT